MLSLVHLIYMAGDKCMRQNACSQIKNQCTLLVIVLCQSLLCFSQHWNRVTTKSHIMMKEIEPEH